MTRFHAGCVLLALAVAGLVGATLPFARSESAPPAPLECRWVDHAPGDGEWEAVPGGGNAGIRLLWDHEFLYFSATQRPGQSRVVIRRTQEGPAAELQFDADRVIAKVPTGPAVVDVPTDAVVRQMGTRGRLAWADLLPLGGRPEPGDSWFMTIPSANAPVTVRFVGPPKLEATSCPTSRVVGAPDPPPYVARRVRPAFSPSYPVNARPVPGTDQMLVITEDSPYAPTHLVRVPDRADAADGQAVKLLSFDGVAYDLAFHPRFAENGFVYVGWNTRDPARGKHFTRVTRYHMDPRPPYAFDPASAAVVIEWPSNGHNGGALCFGPDGMLYVTSGDGTADSDNDLMGQRTDALLAKVLRIDVNRPGAGAMYGVPPDNPFVGDPAFRPETWAYGLRNPWRITIDSESGQLWVGNNGQDAWEQAYLVRKGENYGWSVVEGGHPFYPTRKAGPTPVTKPTVEHPHAEARSLTGGVVYRGAALPELRGAYVYGDYSTGRVWAVKHDGQRVVWHKELARTTLKITALVADGRGELLVCDHQPAGHGGFYTLAAAPAGPPAAFPERLSDTGLFTSVRDHAMAAGVLPYEVNAPFWSDGLFKQRYLALPPGGKIGWTRAGGWSFPDLTVAVKSFAVEAREGDPASRRWVETRLFTRQGGEWAGYSYVWDDDGRDARLVGPAGLDREFEVHIPAAAGREDGKRTVAWRYPSRAECMTCHSRAANFVLGLCTAQMNRPGPGGGENQLAALERRDLFEVDRGDAMKDLLGAAATRRRLTGKAADTFVAERQGFITGGTVGLLPQPPRDLPALVNPYDATLDLGRRARSWLHSNCSSCHVEAGGGNARFDVNMATADDKTGLFGVRPLHRTFDLPDARLVAPGHPDRSVLLARAAARGPNQGQMPPLATHRADEAGVRLLREWIQSLPP